ncbi:MAG: LysE family translocator [Chloroflexi bacterium]|jgi:threonine/homoserine/homoserine lactone efflux protein|nr:LysE family translocator [Chloroflexota bacterium]
MWDGLLGFAVVAGMLTMLPGLDTAQVLRSATLGGPRVAYATLAGILGGVFIWGAAAAIGVGALLEASRLAYYALQLGGAAYLIYTGARIVWAARHPAPSTDLGAGEGARAGWVATFVRALVITLTNPKVGLFYVAMLAPFLPDGVPPVAGGLLLAGIHNLEALAWYSVLIWGANLAREAFARPRVRQWMERVSGVALVGFGVRVAFDR